MKQCSHCGTTVLFGGVKEEGLAFCNAQCREAGALAVQAQRIPADEVARAMAGIAEGSCPICAGPGPVDVFTSYRVFSALIVTSWRSRPRVSCRACATKRQIQDTFYCLFLGWWGVPWGFLMTPVQIFRNLAGLSRNADSARPSKLLESFVRARLAAQASEPESTRRAA